MEDIRNCQTFRRIDDGKNCDQAGGRWKLSCQMNEDLEELLGIQFEKRTMRHLMDSLSFI